MTEASLSKPLATPKVNANGAKNPTLSFRVRGDLYDRLKDSAQSSGYSISEAIERRLLSSFDLEDQMALQDEIKAEMRGTIAALEREIDVQQRHAVTMKAVELLFWPDEGARTLGRAFAMALGAVRHVGGKDWREDPAVPVILAGVMRRVMDRCSRNGGSLASELLDRERIASTTEAVAASLWSFIDEAMPPLPPLQPQDDPDNWTSRAYSAATFRDRATGELLQLVRGLEFDITDPAAERGLGPDHRAAVDRFRPIRDTVDAESFIVFALKDGSTAWQSLEKGGAKVHVPAGQDAPPPAPRPERPDPDAPPEPEAPPAPKRGRKAKART